MHARIEGRKFAMVGAVGAILFAAACESPSVLGPGDNASFARSVHAHTAGDELLRSVRQATARFHSTDRALAAGYLRDAHCVHVPGLGGMGYHWVNPDYIDPTFDPEQPEVLLYATGPGGNLKLVAVEYIVIDVGQDRPSFGDHPLDVGGTPIPVPHWSLHVWLYEENPNGIFSPFNPNVGCP
jgi:hypothetical protein